jgi:hypothetical protein
MCQRPWCWECVGLYGVADAAAQLGNTLLMGAVGME